MFVFTALTPHSPLLLPTIGKEHTARLADTLRAFEQLQGDLYAAKPDTIVIITPHGPKNKAHYLMNFAPRFTAHFEEFSDLSTKNEYAGDSELSHRIKEHLETKLPLQLTTEELLDYGTSIPLHFLATRLGATTIIPLSTAADLDYAAHYELGQNMRGELVKTNKRVAVIASMEFSSRLSKQSPAGYHAGAKKFDQRILNLIKTGENAAITAVKPDQAQRVGAVDLPALAVLLGLLETINYTPRALSYESPFGIGHAVIHFEL